MIFLLMNMKWNTKEDHNMSKYKRTIRYQYYQIKAKMKDNTFRIFNFAKWIKLIEDNNLMQTAIPFNDAIARIEKCAFSEGNGTWGIRILKLRDTNIPSKAKNKEDAKVIELGDGEYIGEDIFLIFHPESGIALIQQNRLSLGISRIEEFLEETFNRFVPEGKQIAISIVPILNINSKTKIGFSDYKYLEIGLANINQFVSNENRKSLKSLMEPLKNMYGVTGSVKISLGRSGFDTLNKREINELVKEIGMPSNKRYIRSAKLKIKEEDDTDVEVIDLFNDVCNEFIEFDIDSTVGLSYSIAISKMNEKFAKRKDELQGLVNYIEESK